MATSMATKIEIRAQLIEIGERVLKEEDNDDVTAIRGPRPCAVFEYVHGNCRATIDLISTENAQALGAFLYRKGKITIEFCEETT